MNIKTMKQGSKPTLYFKQEFKGIKSKILKKKSQTMFLCCSINWTKASYQLVWGITPDHTKIVIWGFSHYWGKLELSGFCFIVILEIKAESFLLHHQSVESNLESKWFLQMVTVTNKKCSFNLSCVAIKLQCFMSVTIRNMLTVLLSVLGQRFSAVTFIE